jgi:hypothetical protein
MLGYFMNSSQMFGLLKNSIFCAFLIYIIMYTKARHFVPILTKLRPFKMKQ